MGDVISFSKAKKKQSKTKRVMGRDIKEVIALNGNGGFTDEVKLDINVMCNALGIDDAEQAIRLARDFYRKYPALMEWVSSPEVAIYKGKDIVGLLLNYKL